MAGSERKRLIGSQPQQQAMLLLFLLTATKWQTPRSEGGTRARAENNRMKKAVSKQVQFKPAVKNWLTFWLKWVVKFKKKKRGSAAAANRWSHLTGGKHLPINMQKTKKRKNKQNDC